MLDNHDKSQDLSDAKSIPDSFRAVSVSPTEGASVFLSRICAPAAAELGVLLSDKARAWRANNAAKIATRAEKKLDALPDAIRRHAHPRLVVTLLEHGSCADFEEVQEFWAGLLATSCTPTGDDDSNMIFIDLLSQLTFSEVRLLAYFCQTAKKTLSPVGSIAAFKFDISLQELLTVSHVDDFHRIDRELDHLRALGLIDGGFHVQYVQCYLSPTTLALQMYARCCGWSDDPAKFYGLQTGQR